MPRRFSRRWCGARGVDPGTSQETLDRLRDDPSPEVAKAAASRTSDAFVTHHCATPSLRSLLPPPY